MQGIAKKALATEWGKQMARRALHGAITGAVGRDFANAMVRRNAGTQRGAGILSSLGGAVKGALTSDTARDMYSTMGNVMMGKLMKKIGGKKPPKRKKKKSGNKKRPVKKNRNQKGGVLPLAAALPALGLIGKTAGLGALGGASGFGVKKLLDLF